MINEKFEKTIRNLMNNNIRYPLIVIGFDKDEYKIYDLYINQNRIMMKVSNKGFIFTDKVSNFSFEFQENLIKELKLFNNSIWDD